MSRFKIVAAVAVALGLCTGVAEAQFQRQVYTVKFLCGEIEEDTAAGTVREGPVKPGNYQTAINIHNPTFNSTFIVKRVLLLYDDTNPPTVFEQPELLAGVRHGLAYLREAHLNRQTGGYAWLIEDGRCSDSTNHCYGLAFVLLAYATALQAGVGEAEPWLEETFQTMERHFWSNEDGLYRDEASVDWVVSPYRGQNANMHCCEAMLAAFEATGEARYLERAHRIARRVTVDLAAKSDGLIWEHYDSHWEIDWNYNRDNPKHLFRPWGFQPGHQTEWAKLLVLLNRHSPEDWAISTSRRLFDTALAVAWDDEHGGIVYGFAPDREISDSDKYFWVQAESFAAAALLAQSTGEAAYWDWYDRIWTYSWDHMVDHRYGAWYRILTGDNRSYSDEKSPAGKTDYHTLGATLDARQVLLNTAATPNIATDEDPPLSI